MGSTAPFARALMLSVAAVSLASCGGGEEDEEIGPPEDADAAGNYQGTMVLNGTTRNFLVAVAADGAFTGGIGAASGSPSQRAICRFWASGLVSFGPNRNAGLPVDTMKAGEPFGGKTCVGDTLVPLRRSRPCPTQGRGSSPSSGSPPSRTATGCGTWASSRSCRRRDRRPVGVGADPVAGGADARLGASESVAPYPL